jgi:DNA-nicking Smr family endonuclease
MHEIPITDIFDLHSFLPRDVKAAVEAYLEEAHARGFRCVRIIHGRGVGVQREMVRTAVSELGRESASRKAEAEHTRQSSEKREKEALCSQ